MLNLKQNMLVTSAIAALFCLFLLIIFGDKGLADLNMLKKARDGLKDKNEMLVQENISLYHSIERLKNDLVFIENIARQELGVVSKNEIIFKISKQ
ncbi:FtsB family cell division protein [Desulfonema magnum]|uniref:Septum formation initiator domain-containing protein n=1 Tax=Desulfonema magnum TaxID=45655 RepID=A0A975GPE8_9BACT|nr:septum formation initiator family protein [Desulfonema magnum]QTA88931.1 Septum formation initiator domain-containing protein [Desulfonema magnum]